MRNPTVTIITTSYNHENYIGTCLQSVIDQTYKDWEQIIVDDGSNDDTFKILSMYAKSDKRIRIFRNNKNFGISRLADNYNKALKISRGKYIAILEGDDYWPKDKLEKQIKSFNDKDVVLSYGNCILVNKSGFPIKLFTYYNNINFQNNSPVGSILKLFYKLSFSIIPVTVMIRKSKLLKIKGFRKDRLYPFTDIPTFLKLALEGKFFLVDEVLGYYRKHGNSQWFGYVSRTNSMGRSELKRQLVNFSKENKNNKNIINAKIDTAIQKKNINYIKLKKITKPYSVFVNKLAFMGGINPMTLFFIVEYLIYKTKKYFNQLCMIYN